MDMRMVDNEDQREDRKQQAGSDAKPEMRRLPNRRERRMIAKRRGIFKKPGLWGYVNTRVSDKHNGDHEHEDQN